MIPGVPTEQDLLRQYRWRKEDALHLLEMGRITLVQYDARLETAKSRLLDGLAELKKHG
ncbi:hypothetical protein KIKIMORA_00210 [Brevundimonas phage vB_BpoS-Kikimora]|uniref:Uncharacterized protein n=1 Tax=Brevundimonas phage vB_BpoS-Kikimora TaxID=2948601 RepID=A0A9E7MR88_9CAUD|nr:hypothetical protein KIKIMORA_00210 [Brevundimonas phage vB_BpoS-Kikimora]